MSKFNHQCSLSAKDTSGLPRLPPNASWISTLYRNIRKSLLVSPRHFKTKKMFRNKSAILAERKKHATSPHFFVIHPLSSFNIVLETMFVIIWLQNIITVPLIAFMDEQVQFKKLHDKIVGPIQVIIILLFFNVGYVIKNTKQTVLIPKKIFCKYIATYFIFDFAATPYMEPILMTHVKFGDKNLVRILRDTAYVLSVFAHAVRIPTLIKVMKDALNNMKVRKNIRAVACHFVKTIQILHILSFVVFVLPGIVYDIIPNASWLYKANLYPKNNGICTKYFESFFITTCFFFGVEYLHDLDLFAEQMFAVCISFFGRLYTLYLLADVLRIFGMAGVSESDYERRMSLVRQYTENQDMPEHLKQRMMEYLEYKYQGHYFRDSEILNDLSVDLRTDIFLFSARKMIEKAAIFKRLPSPTIAAMIAAMKSETYAPRDIIIRIDEPVMDIFFISAGTVAVLNEDNIELCHMEDGDSFGISSFIHNKQQYTIMAVEITELFIMNVGQFFDFLRPFPEVRDTFHRALAQQLQMVKNIEQRVTIDKLNLISELERGNLLEAPLKRMY